jgi:hypothetical protein
VRRYIQRHALLLLANKVGPCTEWDEEGARGWPAACVARCVGGPGRPSAAARVCMAREGLREA